MTAMRVVCPATALLHTLPCLAEELFGLPGADAWSVHVCVAF